jgi:hypothetical protein
VSPWITIPIVVATIASLYMFFLFLRFRSKVGGLAGEIDSRQDGESGAVEAMSVRTPSASGLPRAEVERLERTLGKKLPEFYRQFLRTYPDDLVSLGAPYNTVSELHLPNRVDELIAIGDFGDPPADVLIIRVDGLGNCYFLILDDSDTTVYLFNHEDPVFLDEENEVIDWRRSSAREYASLDDLVADLRESLSG